MCRFCCPYHRHRQRSSSLFYFLTSREKRLCTIKSTGPCIIHFYYTLKLLCFDSCFNCSSLAQRTQKLCAVHVCRLPGDSHTLVPCHSPVRCVIGAYGCRAVVVPHPRWAVIGPPLRRAQKNTALSDNPGHLPHFAQPRGLKHRVTEVPTACCLALWLDLALCPDFGGCQSGYGTEMTLHCMSLYMSLEVITHTHNVYWISKTKYMFNSNLIVVLEISESNHFSCLNKTIN